MQKDGGVVWRIDVYWVFAAWSSLLALRLWQGTGR